jgi:alanyl-tRNA synthetase
LPRLEDVLEQAARGDRVVPGEQAFKLYDTYGLPRDFIEDLSSAQGLRFDVEGFDRAMQGQREKARAKSAFDGRKAEDFVFAADDDRRRLSEVAEQFDGYTTTAVRDVEIRALFNEQKQQVTALSAGDRGFAVLAHTPFYLEAGGQVSDQGRLLTTTSEAAVTGVVRLGPGLPRAHQVEVSLGALRVGDRVAAEVDAVRRDATRRNHTATHLLHAALRRVLGAHVKQAGSLVAPDRLRFDFVHFAALTPDELARIERMVNEHIVANSPVDTAVRDTQEAIAGGAMALFGEKYGDRVRVVSVPEPTAASGASPSAPFSVELCGGTHVRATGDIGAFFITEESGVAAGVRRVEALTGLGAYEHARRRLDQLDEAVRTLNTTPEHLVSTLTAHIASESKLRKDVQQLKTKVALGGGGSGAAADQGRSTIDGVTLIARRVDDVDKESLRSLADTLKSTLTSGIVFLAAPSADGKVSIVATVTPDLTKRAPAGEIVKQLAPIVGGRGGGRPDFAEAGGKDAAKIDDLVKESRSLVERLLSTR